MTTTDAAENTAASADDAEKMSTNSAPGGKESKVGSTEESTTVTPTAVSLVADLDMNPSPTATQTDTQPTELHVILETANLLGSTPQDVPSPNSMITISNNVVEEQKVE